MRCVHEASLHNENSFITLTYDEDNVPSTGTLRKRDWRNFMKRLRRDIHPIKIRFLMCGEYGENQDLTTTETIGRPHYHAIIFGWDFPDKEMESANHRGEPVYTSKQLNQAWNQGFTTIGDFSFDSAAYVARYVTKKITGEEATTHYLRTIKNPPEVGTGPIAPLLPEFNGASLKPGIAREWFNKYRHDMDKGFITMRGIKMPPPKYYANCYAQVDDDHWQTLAAEKRASINPDDPDKTPERLRVREKLVLRKALKLKRNKA